MSSLLKNPPHIVVVGAGIGGLTTAALLAHKGYRVTILEAQTYVGGCAGTFYHKGYHFDAGATIVGGFQPNGPHAIVGKRLNIEWPVRQHDPAWVVHLPDHDIALTQDNRQVLAQFPQTVSFWREQHTIANLAWRMSAQGLPWTPTNLREFVQLAKVGLTNFPQDMGLLPFAFSSIRDWLQRKKLAQNEVFVRFLDAQLLISAQTTTAYANALYGAIALDLARQGVYHVKDGIGGLAITLANKLKALGGEILYRHSVTRLEVEGGRVTGVYAKQGQRTEKEHFFPCDFVVANLTPQSLDTLLAEKSPSSLRRETRTRGNDWGAFVLYIGVKADELPVDLADHHQIITDMRGPLGECRSIFLSISPQWDTNRAPSGHRAVTITTHTAVQVWWDLLERNAHAYTEKKEAYTIQILDAIERVIPNFKRIMKLVMAGTPVTYNSYTGRHMGMVGGFPQTSLFKARGPKTGIANVRLVGDSIFPGQSTAGVTLGALRVSKDIQQSLPLPTKTRLFPIKSLFTETQ